MRYYLYRTDSLFRNKRFERKVIIPDDVAPWKAIRDYLSCRVTQTTKFDHIYDDETGDLCILVATYSNAYIKVDRFEYFRLSKIKDPVPLEMWEVVLLGDIRRDGDHSQISFYVGPDDDPIEKAINVLRKMLENSNSKVTAVSSFKHGTMNYDEDMDLSIVCEFRTQFDGKTQTNIVNVYEVKKV